MALFATHNQTQFQVGDIVRLHIKSQEARRREQIVEGQVLGIRGEGVGKSMLLRRIGAGGIGVEYIMPLMSPNLMQIEVKQKTGTGIRHAKLYFLRGQPAAAFDRIKRRVGKKGRIHQVTPKKQVQAVNKKLLEKSK